MLRQKTIAAASSNAVRGLVVIVLSLSTAAAIGLVVITAHGYKLLSVQSASMQPTIRPGDALLIAPLSAKQLHVGDIVNYRKPNSSRTTISHRLVAINKQTGRLTTAGDALKTADPAFPPSQVIGQAIAIAPGFGLVIDALHQPTGLAIVVYAPAMLIVSNEVRCLARTYARPFYSVRLETCDSKPSGRTPMLSSTARTST